MTSDVGIVLSGNEEKVSMAFKKMQLQEINWNLINKHVSPLRCSQTTISDSVTISGPGTFFGKETRNITIEPSMIEGWWLDRTDLPNSLPIRVSIANVWTTGQIVSNIVLRSGSPHNYVRMVEHMIALRMGIGIDNVIIKLDSGDPPLFKNGSLDIVNAFKKANKTLLNKSVKYYTVPHTVSVGGSNDDFVSLSPPLDPNNPQLTIDCAIDFKTHIGKQRIVFTVCEQLLEMASIARTNTSWSKVLYCKSIGLLFADIRNLGYNKDNVLIASKNKYINKPRLIHENKSLEAVWHRSVLDLLAAIALIPDGRFVGHITSYKAGHRLDCELIRQLFLNQVLKTI